MLQELGTEPTQRRRRVHSVAATFYLLIAIGGLIMAFSGQPAGLAVTAICGLYSAYLWRGGRFVLWIW